MCPRRANFGGIVKDVEWEEFVARVREHAPVLVTQIPRGSVEAALEESPRHPLSRLFREPTSASARLTAHAFEKIVPWLETTDGVASRWRWRQQLNLLPEESSASALAEIRALGAMLPAHGSISGGLKVSAHSALGRAADFRVEGLGDDVFIEVCCARLNDTEKGRVEWVNGVEDRTREAARDAAIAELGREVGSTSRATATAQRPNTSHRLQVSASATRAPDGGHVVLQMWEQTLRPYGDPGTDGEGQTLARRLSGKKPPGQIPEGKAGVLWMDLSDPDWNAAVADTLPFEVFNKGLNLANTRGFWHAFYGRKGVTPFMERHAIGFDFGGSRRDLQLFDGRFRHEEQRCWSVAVLRCTDGVVIFEHPNPSVPLPLTVLRELTDIAGYAPYASIHRFDDDAAAVSRRLEHVEKMLAFFAT